jgi:hypothetical protein
MARAWTLISIAEERQYGGNRGYEDDPRRIYRFDSSVANHLQISQDDLVFIRTRDLVIGMAIIEGVKSALGTKARLRCPVCGSTQIRHRRLIQPNWRCGRGHTFDAPAEQQIKVTTYEAHYDDSFVELDNVITVAQLKDSALRPSDQLSIEEIDIRRVADQIALNSTLGRSLIARFMQTRRSESESFEAITTPNEPDARYTPSFVDTRDRINRSIMLRRGQSTFRKGLVRRYGPRCMITGCELAYIVEAAHIWPYRGTADNHPDNGILLRADLHTLFDLDLLGIQPETLTIHLHHLAKSAGYSDFHGLQLRVGRNKKPSVEALKLRWSVFAEGQ